uniref:Trehalase n=1 Tax=Heterorhabditis bacteriophora TaxID=37862 RepID=A0A1I7XP79_HETBA
MTLHLELVCYIIAVFSEVTSLPKARHLASIKSHPVERSIPTLDETSAKRIDQQLIGSIDEKDQFMQLPKIEWEAEDHELSRISACDRWNTPGRHMIYCSGKLLQAVMATRLHSDSKTFVDRPMKENRTGQFILDAFKKQFPQPVSDITQSDVRKFVDQHFDEEGHELQGLDKKLSVCFNTEQKQMSQGKYIFGFLEYKITIKFNFLKYIKFRDAFKKVFYVAKSKGWYDYNLVTRKHNFEFYASIAVPLFTQCYDPLSTSQTDDLYNQMEEMGVFKFAGGIPTRFVTITFVQILQLQAGFGWTNGAALDLLVTYGDRLRYPGIHPPLIPVPQLFQDKTFEETGLVSSLSHSLSTIGLTLFLCLLCANNS